MRAKIKTFEQAKQLLDQKLSSLGNPKVAFVGQRLGDSQAFDWFIPIDVVVGLDYGSDAELLSKKAVVVSKEAVTGVRQNCYSDGLQQMFGDKFSSGIISNLNEGDLVIPYANSSELERFSAKMGLKLLAPRAEYKQYLENKINLQAVKEATGLPNVSKIFKLSDLPAYEALLKDFGNKFVTQKGQGSSGKGTVFVKNALELSAFLSTCGSESQVVITPYVDGPTISVNGLVTKNQVILFSPSIQVIGNPETAVNPATFSGVEYSEKILEYAQRDKLKEYAYRVGKYLMKNGYVGMYNLNFMANGLFLTDLNPRMMGSLVLMTELQRQSGELPLALLLLLAQLGVDFELDEEAINQIGSVKKGAFIVLHSLEGEPKTVGGVLNEYVAKADFSLDFSGLRGGEFLMGGAIPEVGKLIEPEAPLLRIYSKSEVLDSRFKLTDSARDICEKVYRQLQLT